VPRSVGSCRSPSGGRAVQDDRKCWLIHVDMHKPLPQGPIISEICSWSIRLCFGCQKITWQRGVKLFSIGMTAFAADNAFGRLKHSPSSSASGVTDCPIFSVDSIASNRSTHHINRNMIIFLVRQSLYRAVLLY